MSVLLDLGTGAEVVDGTAHVEDVLPGHALAVDHVAEELESFVRTGHEVRTLALLEAEGVRGKGLRSPRVPARRRCGASGCRRGPPVPIWPKMPLAVVLMPHGHGWGWIRSVDPFGDE